MKELLNLRLFSLVRESMQTKVDPLEMEKAYNELAISIQQKSKSEGDLFFFYYQLGYSLLEINELLSGLKKKWSKLLFRKSYWTYSY